MVGKGVGLLRDRGMALPTSFGRLYIWDLHPKQGSELTDPAHLLLYHGQNPSDPLARSSAWA